jgi:hypothetical protein
MPSDDHDAGPSVAMIFVSDMPKNVPGNYERAGTSFWVRLERLTAHGAQPGTACVLPDVAGSPGPIDDLRPLRH